MPAAIVLQVGVRAREVRFEVAAFLQVRIAVEFIEERVP